MSTINILSSKVFNRIAAGEVVERPASVVKELVENSIDAGAKNITIEIIGGGLTSIIITDNGCGIEKKELSKALLPHATSKISKISDLDDITTLGFRGEALASVASVSKIKIISKPLNQDNGAFIYAEGGESNDVLDCASPIGTQIQVDNLFYNAPVRAKFLKSERSEEGEISACVARFILGHPDISFKLICDGKTILSSFGDGLESAFVNVYGVDTINNCFYVDTEKNGIKINGYLGKHNFSKSNRSHQTVFLNGRYVVNQTISSSISNAYSPYLMKRQYPFFCLNIVMPSVDVDVNVHPNKIDVRFINNQVVYGTLFSVVSKVLDGTSEALNIVTNINENVKNNEGTSISNNTQSNVFTTETKNNNSSFDMFKLCENEEKTKKQDDINSDVFAENKKFIEELEKKKIEQTTLFSESSRQLNLIGQALKTFLIFEDGEDLFFIDQHAAHERILFDKFNESVVKSDVYTQPLLIPFILNVSNFEYDFIIDKIGALLSIGIDISEFGKNSFKVSSVPAMLNDINLQSFFDDIISDITSLKSITLSSVLTEKLAQKACKAAIKSGDLMSDDEIKCLLKLLKGNLGLKCPHGRPICIKISRTEIDKWFKRIV